MPRSGGTYTLPAGNPVVTGTTISSTTYNNTQSDIASALTQSVSKDGQTTMTGNLPMGGFKLTGLGNGSAASDSATVGQISANTGSYVATVGGTTDVITLTPSPAITAYAAGQKFSFISAGANTTNVTVNISGLGAKALTKFGTTALVANDMPAAGQLVAIEYDGTQFQLMEFLVTGTSGHKIPLLDADNTFSGQITMSGKSLWTAKGANVASASSCNIWTTDGNTVHVTGTTTVADWGTAPQAGATKTVIFDGALQLTYNATTNKLNTNGANYTTVAGDRALIYADTTTSFVVSIIPFSGESAVINRGMTKLNSGSVSSAATLDIVMTSYTAYKNKVLVFESFIPASNGVILYFRVSTDGGSTYDSAAASYRYAVTGLRDDGVSNNSNSASATEMILSGANSIVNTAGFGISGRIEMFDTINTAMNPRFAVETAHNNSGGWCNTNGMGARQNTQDTDAIRLFFSSGNIASGTWTLYGYN